MKRLPTARCAVAALLLLLALFTLPLFAAEGRLTGKDIEKIRDSFKMDACTRAMYNALTNTDISELALNRDILRKHNDLFSHKIKAKGITNQKGSERCWLYAGLNMLRPAVVEKHKLEKFEFSQNYIGFWDKFEKANCFLEFMIKMADRDPLDRELEFLFKKPFQEGGWWDYIVLLIDKYGAVPLGVMPETQSSSHSASLHRLISQKLRVDAVKLREMHRNGEPVNKLRAAKMKMLKEIYRMLVMNLGEPPKEFYWRYRDNKSKLSELKKYTPKSFYRDFVGGDLHEYVSIFNDPTQEYGKYYRVKLTRDMAEGPDVLYANVDGELLKSIALKSVLDDQPVCFSCDVSQDQNPQYGILALNIYDYSTVYGVDLELDKAEQLLTRQAVVNHCMVFIGVDVRDGAPVKWLVENSWGEGRGSGGYFTLYNDYFDKHVYNIIVKKAYVPEDVLKIFQQKPIPLPVWYPTTAMFR
jgi:bleomycin hydrolase